MKTDSAKKKKKIMQIVASMALVKLWKFYWNCDTITTNKNTQKWIYKNSTIFSLISKSNYPSCKRHGYNIFRQAHSKALTTKAAFSIGWKNGVFPEYTKDGKASNSCSFHILFGCMYTWK